MRGLAGGSSPSVALGEGFPECNWHSGKPEVPVVNFAVSQIGVGAYLQLYRLDNGHIEEITMDMDI